MTILTADFPPSRRDIPSSALIERQISASQELLFFKEPTPPLEAGG